MTHTPSSALGPSGRLVERFLDRLQHMRPDDFASVVQRWRETLRRTDTWYAAEDAVGETVARTRRDGAMWVVQDRLYAIFRGTPWYASQLPGPPHAAEMAAQYLSTTAAVALLVADALAAEHLATVYAPFAEAVPLADLALGTAPVVEPEARGRGGRTMDRGDEDDGRIRH